MSKVNLGRVVGKSTYEIWLEQGNEGTEEEFVESLKGKDGITPTIGENGNWYIGDTDTGLPSRGENSGSSSGTTTSILEGKTILAIGDSFVKGHTLNENKTWVSKIATRNNMTKYVYATNGISLTGSNSSTLAKQMDTIISNVKSADYVVLLAGHNDANPSLNGGTAVPIGENSDSNDTTFKGGLNLIINKLLTAYPTAHILFLTPFNRRGIEEEYAQAMKEICGIWCIPCFDNYHNGNMCFQNEAQQGIYELSGSLHYNEAGQERLSYLYESILTNNLAINYSAPSTTKTNSEIDASQFVTTTMVPYKITFVKNKETFDALSTKDVNTIYFVGSYGVYLGIKCIISTDNQEGSGSEETTTFVPFGTLSSIDAIRYYVEPTLESGDIVNFKSDELWETYKYAIGPGTGRGTGTSWIGGGYQTGPYTVETAGNYTIMVAKQDNSAFTSEDLEILASSLGVTRIA